MSIQVTLPIFPAAEAGGEVETDQEGTGYGNTHFTSFHPSSLDIEYPPPWLINIPYLTLIKLSFIVNLIHHCEVYLFLCFVPVQSSASAVVWCGGVQYFISGKIRSSCSIGSQSYHPTDQWTLPFYFLVSSVSTCQYTTLGDTSPFYNNLTHF